jgi:hypothetical protein
VIKQQDRKPFLKARDILSPDVCAKLTPEARGLYAAVWNRLTLKKLTSLWMHDDEAARRSLMIANRLPSAQSELSRFGLLVLIPGEIQTRYEFPTDETELLQN